MNWGNTCRADPALKEFDLIDHSNLIERYTNG